MGKKSAIDIWGMGMYNPNMEKQTQNKKFAYGDQVRAMRDGKPLHDAEYGARIEGYIDDGVGTQTVNIYNTRHEIWQDANVADLEMIESKIDREFRVIGETREERATNRQLNTVRMESKDFPKKGDKVTFNEDACKLFKREFKGKVDSVSIVGNDIAAKREPFLVHTVAPRGCATGDVMNLAYLDVEKV